MTRRRFAAALLATLALVATACSGDPAEDAAAGPQPEPNPTATAAPVEPPADAREPTLQSTELAGFQPRTVVYANIEYTVTSVRLSNEALQSYASGGEPAIADEFYAYLDITAVNRMSRTMTQQLSASIYKLRIGDREYDAADEMGFLSELTGFIRANTGVDSFLAFRVPDDAELEEAWLFIGATPKRRAALPLTGEMPVGIYPLEVEVSGAAEGTAPTNPGTVLFTVLGATLSEDQPHENATSPTGHRANEDELFLVIHVRAEKVSGGGPDSLGPSAFRLLVDGVPRAPWDSANDPRGGVTPTLHPGAAIDAWVAFLAPISATEFVLQAGDFTEQPALIPIHLPPMS